MIKTRLFSSILAAGILLVTAISSLVSAATTYTVAADGSGDYKTLQAAFNAVPSNNSTPITIFVKKGTYKEKDSLVSGKNYVTLIGENRDSTIITYDDHNASTSDPSQNTYTILISADNFTAQNITFQNTKTAISDYQAVGLRVDGDKAAFYNCNIAGGQDIYCAWGTGRIYNKNCNIEGTSDFIYGASIAVFDSCTIVCKKKGACMTAAKTPQNNQYGFVFMNCTIGTDSVGKTSALGRPWGAYAKTVLLNCVEGSVIPDTGWRNWSTTSTNNQTCYFGEYKCSGPGYVPASRVSWSHQLTDAEAATYTLAKIFSKNAAATAYSADWVPQITPVGVAVGRNSSTINCLSLDVDVANGNSGSILSYALPSAIEQPVTLTISDLKGRTIKRLTKNNIASGTHSIVLPQAQYPSGVYFLSLDTENKRMTARFSIQ